MTFQTDDTLSMRLFLVAIEKKGLHGSGLF